jgi:hypothetical protein
MHKEFWRGNLLENRYLENLEENGRVKFRWL